MVNSAVIMAGSNPSHKSQLMQGVSRTMLPALGKPMIARVMDQLYRAGIRHFIVIVGLHDGEVASYLNTHWVPDAKVEFLMKGTGQSFLQQLSGIATRLDSPFLLTNYNNFVYDAFIRSLIKQHAENDTTFILSAARNMLSDSGLHYFATVNNGAVTTIDTEKAAESFILNELSICGKEFIEYLKNGAGSTTSPNNNSYLKILSVYLNEHPGKIHLAEASWMLQVESDSDLLRLNRQLLGNSNDAHILSELPRNVKVISPVRIDPGVSVGQNAVIGPYVYLEKGARIGEGSHIDNAVILSRAYVPPRSHISNMLLSSKGSITG